MFPEDAKEIANPSTIVLQAVVRLFIVVIIQTCVIDQYAIE